MRQERTLTFTVIPAQAGTQKRFFIWVPACAGMTAMYTDHRTSVRSCLMTAT